MNKQRVTNASRWTSYLILVLVAAACKSTGDRVTPTLASATSELVKIARRHNVTIREGQVSFVTDGATVVAHAPIAGIERYTDADFTDADGAPIQVIFVASREEINLPLGSYLVKAQFQVGASEGKALFVNENGTTVTQRNLIIRDRVQTAALFPDVYSDSPAAIPDVTSTHFFVNQPTRPGGPKVTRWVVDCTGWTPKRTVFY